MATGMTHRVLAHLVPLVAVVAGAAGCSFDDDSAPDPEPVDEQLAIWISPSPTPQSVEDAAANAMRKLLDMSVTLGPYMAGDSRSGEIEVLFGESNHMTVRSLVLMRQLGSEDRWAVLAAVAPGIRIDTPDFESPVIAGLVTVSGIARGFEGTVTVTALRKGDPMEILDQAITTGGSLGDPEPFDTLIDLSAARAGETVTIVVRGDAGHENDPGEFSAIPIRVAG